jgi:hypothetical protein
MSAQDYQEFIDSQQMQNNGANNTPVASPLSVFEQAGNLQSTAATEGADAEIAGIQEMIAKLQGLLGGDLGEVQSTGMDNFRSVADASTTEGFGSRLDKIIGGGAFGGLVDERMRGAAGMLSAGGLSRSGTAMEAGQAIPTELALQLENQQFGRESNLANTGFQAQSQQLSLNQQIANLLGNIGGIRGTGIRSSGEAEAGGILGEAGFNMQAQQQKDQNQSDMFGTIGTALGTTYGGGPLGGAIGGAIGSAFSDPRLKTNVQIKGKIGPLDLVTWDWIEAAKNTIVGNYRTIGFMSTQVKEFYPDLVSEYAGYDVVNYTGLMERLDG